MISFIEEANWEKENRKIEMRHRGVKEGTNFKEGIVKEFSPKHNVKNNQVISTQPIVIFGMDRAKDVKHVFVALNKHEYYGALVTNYVLGLSSLVKSVKQGLNSEARLELRRYMYSPDTTDSELIRVLNEYGLMKYSEYTSAFKKIDKFIFDIDSKFKDVVPFVIFVLDSVLGIYKKDGYAVIRSSSGRAQFVVKVKEFELNSKTKDYVEFIYGALGAFFESQGLKFDYSFLRQTQGIFVPDLPNFKGFPVTVIDKLGAPNSLTVEQIVEKIYTNLVKPYKLYVNSALVKRFVLNSEVSKLLIRKGYDIQKDFEETKKAFNLSKKVLGSNGLNNKIKKLVGLKSYQELDSKTLIQLKEIYVAANFIKDDERVEELKEKIEEWDWDILSDEFEDVYNLARRIVEDNVYSVLGKVKEGEFRAVTVDELSSKEKQKLEDVIVRVFERAVRALAQNHTSKRFTNVILPAASTAKKNGIDFFTFSEVIRKVLPDKKNLEKDLEYAWKYARPEKGLELIIGARRELPNDIPYSKFLFASKMYRLIHTNPKYTFEDIAQEFFYLLKEIVEKGLHKDKIQFKAGFVPLSEIKAYFDEKHFTTELFKKFYKVLRDEIKFEDEFVVPYRKMDKNVRTTFKFYRNFENSKYSDERMPKFVNVEKFVKTFENFVDFIGWIYERAAGQDKVKFVLDKVYVEEAKHIIERANEIVSTRTYYQKVYARCKPEEILYTLKIESNGKVVDIDNHRIFFSVAKDVVAVVNFFKYLYKKQMGFNGKEFLKAFAKKNGLEYEINEYFGEFTFYAITSKLIEVIENVLKIRVRPNTLRAILKVIPEGMAKIERAGKKGYRITIKMSYNGMGIFDLLKEFHEFIDFVGFLSVRVYAKIRPQIETAKIIKWGAPIPKLASVI